ncbi:MAG: hypothetical protein WBD55_00265 [Dehalococcoidia bacterium]
MMIISDELVAATIAERRRAVEQLVRQRSVGLEGPSVIVSIRGRLARVRLSRMHSSPERYRGQVPVAPDPELPG